MKKFLLLGLLLAGSVAQAQNPPPVPQAPATPTNFVSNGERVPVPDAGFSIVPPVGWEVIANNGGSSLLFQAPKPPGSTKEFTYQANIRVMAFFNNPTAIDDIAKDEWGKVITEKMSNISNRTTEFALLSSEKIQLQTGSDAILFYSSFHYDDLPMMQMHILVSNAKNTFLMTYTDFAKIFEQQGSPQLQTAYASMHSAELDGKPTPRFQKLIFIGGGVLALFVFWFLIRFFRGRRIAKMGDSIDDYDGGSDSSFTTGVSLVTEVDSRSMVSEIVEKKSSKSRRAVEEDEGHDDDDSYRYSEARADDDYPASEVESVHRAPPPPKAKAPTPPRPESRPVPPPAAKAAPAPSRSSSVSASAAPKDRFENRKRKETTVSSSVHPKTSTVTKPASAAVSHMESDVAPVSEAAWDLGSVQMEDEAPLSDVMPESTPAREFERESKTKSNKIVARDEDFDFAEDRQESEVARLSEILPVSEMDEPKKKGFLGGLFGGGKKEKEEPEMKAKKSKNKPSRKDDEDMPPVSAVSDAWAIEDKKKVGKSAGTNAQPMSEVAGGGWNLDGDSGSADDDDD